MFNPSGRVFASLSAAVVALFSGSAALAQQFVEQQSTRFPQPALNEYTNQCILADLDSDGDLDIVFANGGNFSTAGTPQKLRVFINNGLGFFTDETDARTGGLALLARDVEAGDVDHDGDLDLAVACDFSTLPRLLINNGAGFFTDSPAKLPAVALSSNHCAFGDVDNDGDLDLAFCHGGASRFGNGQTQLYLNDGAGNFTSVTATHMPVQLVSQPLDVLFADIDGDYDLDMLIGSRGTNGSKLYRNDGTGHFSDITAGNLPANGTVYSFDFGDYNGDGPLDIVGVNAASGSSQDTVFQNNGSGTFTNVSATALPTNPNTDDNDSRFIDLNYDGHLDLVIASLGSTERAYINNGAAALVLTAGVFQAVADASLDIEVGDLDGDGDLDAVTAQGESGSFINRIYMNQGAAKDNRPPKIHKYEMLPSTSSPGPHVVRAVVRDDMTTDSNFFYDSIAVVYSLNGGAAITQEMRWSGGDLYRGTIPGQFCGTEIAYHVRAVDMAGNVATSAPHAFKVLPPPAADLVPDGKIDQADLGTLLASYEFDAGGDIDGDGDTDQADLGVLLSLFGCGT